MWQQRTRTAECYASDGDGFGTSPSLMDVAVQIITATPEWLNLRTPAELDALSRRWASEEGPIAAQVRRMVEVARRGGES